MRSSLSLCPVVVFGFALLAVNVSVRADDVAVQEPVIVAASREGELAKAGIKTPDGVEIQLFAAEPQLANPVAFGFDEQGRVYVCETFRQQRGVEDNRSHMVWLEDDLAARSVADRLAFFRKHLGDAVADYARQQDRIRRLEDTNGDGVADLDTVYAGPFHEIEEGTGAGVLVYQGTAYYTNIPRLWSLRDTDSNGVADQQTPLADGFGVRVAFRGHDMHGLTLGPDGRLYFSIGDRGYNVTTREGRRLVRPDTGAVFRCELDGSELEVFAAGLRNPQELAFDDHGNLFTGDNNSDGGDQARWVQVVEASDTGWRMYYQYLSDRGPWNRERMWHPYRDDDETTAVQPAFIVPPIANLGDGPSGLAYYPGVGLAERYRGHFFLADFRGSTSRSGVRSFAVEPHGATFKLVDSHWYIENLLATDVDFGYDGRLYVSDWVDGWNGPGKGRIYSFSDTRHADARRAAGVAALFAAGFDQRPADELVALLGHPDRRVRQRAQFALAERTATNELIRVATSPGGFLPRLHALWGLWQVGRKAPSQSVTQALHQVAAGDDPELRAQACRVLGDLRDATAQPLLLRAIAQGTPREQAFAAIAIGRLPAQENPAPVLEALAALLAANGDADPVLRHAAIMGLVGQGTPRQWLKFQSHASPSVRLGVVVALRRSHSAELAQFLDDPAPHIVAEAARAIHDLPVAEALPALAALADRPAGSLADLVARRVLNANYRLGGPGHAAALARWVAADTPPHLREEALWALLHWEMPPVLDRVTNEYRPLPHRSRDAARPSVEQLIPQLLAGDAALRAQGVELAAHYELQGFEPQLAALATSTDQTEAVQAAAISALVKLQSAQAPAAVAAGLKSSAADVRVAALRGAVALHQPDVPQLLQQSLLNVDASLRERQAAAALLADTATPEADAVLASLLGRLLQTPSSVSAAIQLDLVTAAERRGGEVLLQAVASLQVPADPANPLPAYRMCLEGGDARRGKDIFFGNAAASCRRCHKVEGEGSEVGPDLSGVGKLQSREYLLEAIVNPNAKIAKGFETVIFVMDDGLVYTGVVKGEDDLSYQLMTAQGEVIRVEKARIEERATGKSGMPEDVTKSLTKSDVRDLVEYLSTLRTPAQDAAAHGKDGH